MKLTATTDGRKLKVLWDRVNLVVELYDAIFSRTPHAAFRRGTLIMTFRKMRAETWPSFERDVQTQSVRGWVVRVVVPPGKAGVVMMDGDDASDPFRLDNERRRSDAPVAADRGYPDDVPMPPPHSAARPPYISRLRPHASALLTAGVAPGYRVLEIDGASCRGVSADVTAAMLTSAADRARTLVLAPPPPPEIARAAILRGTTTTAEAAKAAEAQRLSFAAFEVAEAAVVQRNATARAAAADAEAAASRAVRGVRQVSWRAFHDVAPLGAGTDGLGGDQVN